MDPTQAANALAPPPATQAAPPPGPLSPQDLAMQALMANPNQQQQNPYNQQAMQGMGNQGLNQMLGQMQLMNQATQAPPQNPIPGL